MAVKEASSNYKSFTFNGVSAADYGVYVTDVNVFNSAERAVEYITIPGRNGSFALDHGRFENITVVYDCALGQDTDADFVTAISDFRNALASAKGYQRLEDDMNPDEYRMAVFSKGLEAPTLNQQTATFKVEFNCKPQRYLKSGETAISVASGGTVTNPTPFDASPILEIDGAGTVDIGGNQIVLGLETVGTVNLATANDTGSIGRGITSTLRNTGTLNTGDVITVAAGSVAAFDVRSQEPLISDPREVSNIAVTGGLECSATANVVWDYYHNARFTVTVGAVRFINGTSETKTATLTADIAVDTNGGYPFVTKQITATITMAYNAQAQTVTLSIEYTTFPSPLSATSSNSRLNAITGESTKSTLTGTTVIDLEVGEAYQTIDGETVSVNNVVSIPADLPTLVPGANAITYDNTITSLRVIPRWWKV